MFCAVFSLVTVGLYNFLSKKSAGKILVKSTTIDSSQVEDCFQMVNNSRWNDIDCKKKLHVICERKQDCNSTSSAVTSTTAATAIEAISTSSSTKTENGKYLGHSNEIVAKFKVNFA